MRKRLMVFVSGFVQGVGYRYFVLCRATELGIFGFVKNLEDGSVEIVVEGEEESLKKFLQKLDHGLIFARVRKISSNWAEPTGEFNSFRIEY